MSRSKKKAGGTRVAGLDYPNDKPHFLSQAEWESWQEEEWDDRMSRSYLDESFAEANAASVLQWSSETRQYEKVPVKDVGKNKKASGIEKYEKREPAGFGMTGWSSGYDIGKGPSSTVSTLAAEPKCTHEGISPVLTIPTGTQFYAASSAYAREASYLCDMAIDVGANIADSLSTKSFCEPKGRCDDATRDRIKALNDCALSLPPIIRLDWPDMGIPPAGLAFWRALINILPSKGKVVIACIGSHGRTGTTLAALCIVTMGMTARQAIDHVRAVHCKKAIESMAQEKYLQALSDARDRETSAPIITKAKR